MAETELVVKGRHDPCIVIRALPVVEGALALALDWPAAMPLAHRVSPPTGGSCLAARMASAGGVSMKVTSVCQLSLSGGLSSWVSSTMISSASGAWG